MHKQVENYILQGKQLNLSKKTIDNRKNVLYPLLRFLNGRPLTLEITQEYIRHLYDRKLSTTSLDCYIKTLRAFVNYLEYDWSKKLLRPKIHRKPLEIIPSELAEKVILTGTEPSMSENGRCKKAKESARLCLRFILRTGLRVSEALSLTYESLNFDDETFRVLSKGGDWDILPLPRDLIEELKDYSSGKLFTNTPKTLNHLIQNGLRKTGVNTPLTVHSLRHIFATSLLRSGIAPQIVQRLLRHKNFAVTDAIYSHYVISDLSNALNSQIIVRKGLTVNEIFDNLEKSVRNLLDERFNLQITREDKSILLSLRLLEL